MPAELVWQGLFLGDAAASMAPDVLAYDLIVNVTREVPFSKCLRPDQRIVRYDILDDPDSDQRAMAKVCMSAAQLLHKALSAGDNVLIHCMEGKQRSATVVAAYLILKGMRKNDAIKHVHDCRPAAWDYGHYVHYEDALSMLGRREGNEADTQGPDSTSMIFSANNAQSASN